jgi:hypothetical protein
MGFGQHQETHGPPPVAERPESFLKSYQHLEATIAVVPPAGFRFDRVSRE